jgi:hypothetical protein
METKHDNLYQCLQGEILLVFTITHQQIHEKLMIIRVE